MAQLINSIPPLASFHIFKQISFVSNEGHLLASCTCLIYSIDTDPFDFLTSASGTRLPVKYSKSGYRLTPPVHLREQYAQHWGLWLVNLLPVNLVALRLV